MDILNYLLILILVTLSGLFSGLTLGLMGLSKFDLKRKVKLGDSDAKKIYPLRKNGNLLLCTLILGNVTVNTALAIFLGSVANGLAAGILATSLIVVFGEIIPQAVFSKHALRVGAKFVPLVYFFLYLFYPITKPLSLALDKTIGSEIPRSFSKKEFRVFIEQQKKIGKGELEHQEYAILQGGLLYADKEVRDVMTPRVNTFFLEEKTALTDEALKQIQTKGHSRIPVYRKVPDRIVGLLYGKDLISLKSSDKLLVKNVMRKGVLFVTETDKLDEVLKKFKTERIHLFLVLDEFKGVAGIISLEDILEEISGEIVDEYDVIVDMRKMRSE